MTFSLFPCFDRKRVPLSLKSFFDCNWFRTRTIFARDNCCSVQGVCDLWRWEVWLLWLLDVFVVAHAGNVLGYARGRDKLSDIKQTLLNEQTIPELLHSVVQETLCWLTHTGDMFPNIFW